MGLILPVNIVVKAKSFEEIKEVINKAEEIREANPHDVIKTTIEIDLRD